MLSGTLTLTLSWLLKCCGACMISLSNRWGKDYKGLQPCSTLCDTYCRTALQCQVQNSSRECTV